MQKKIRPNDINWQTALKQAVRSVDELLDRLSLNLHQIEADSEVNKHFPLRVPISFIERMEKGNPNDPLLRQVMPLKIEQATTKGYTLDPVGDIKANKVPGLLHKYNGRVLLTITGSCAIHCRYCFRQHFPYSEHGIKHWGWEPALNYIQQDTSLKEVILSGGDPLLAHDETLTQLGQQLEKIPHLKRLRIHTRLPIVLPERITAGLCQWLQQQQSLKTIIVIHCNHPQEINEAVSQALDQLHQTPTQLLNQSVLLKGVNDSSQILADLSEKLFDNNVLPYYLHQLDKTAGTAHFEVDETRAQQIVKELRAILPGYLVPQWVKEEAGRAYKTIMPS